MGIFRRLAGLFGLARDDEAREPAAAPSDGGGGGDRASKTAAQPPRSRGFGVQVPVSVDRHAPGPILLACNLGEGGVQGFRWYARRLRIDEDGDVADEFFDEVTPETAVTDNTKEAPKFRAKYNTRPTALAMRKQTVVVDGNIHHSLEYQGQLRWI